MVDMQVPLFSPSPSLSSELVDEITNIIFGVQPHLSEIRPCDLIFIFGGVDEGLWLAALKAYEAGIARQFVVTGGSGSRTPQGVVESDLIVKHLVEKGVPAKEIFSETKSTNSYENVICASDIYDFDKVRTVLMVCTSRGIGRQSRTLEHQFKHIEVVPFSFHSRIPGLDDPLTPENWVDMEVSRDYIWGQVLRIHLYGEKGHLRPLRDVSDELTTLILASLDAIS